MYMSSFTVAVYCVHEQVQRFAFTAACSAMACFTLTFGNFIGTNMMLFTAIVIYMGICGHAVTLETLPLVVLSAVTNCTATWTDTIALTSCSPGLRSTLAGERAMTLNQGSLWVEMVGDANVEALQNEELDAYFDQLHASPQRCDSDLDSVAS